jgi:glycerophosphoryl diester phosphodiesterase
MRHRRSSDHGLAPDVALSPGLSRLTERFLKGAEVNHTSRSSRAHRSRATSKSSTPQRLHDESRAVWVWHDDASTQENADFYDILIDTGVDGIITGRPGEMVAALGN